MLKLSSIRFLGLSPYYMGFLPKQQYKTYRVKSENIEIVPMSAKPQQPLIWINEAKKVSIPEISKSTKMSFKK